MNLNKFCLTTALFFFFISSDAQNIVRISPAEPLNYRQNDGHLELLEVIRFSQPCPQKAILTLDGSTLKFERTAVTDSITVWMPMIGGSFILELSEKGKVLDSRRVQAPIQRDWGVFAGGEIHLIQSSHQDIAWMDTPDYCRTERINDIVIPALDMMKEDSAFTFEMEQTLNLMELLEACPEKKEEVGRRLKEGRFTWGATYNQPYEGLSSGEQLVRQAYFGRKWINENFHGCDVNTAFNPDVPGRTAQMPQILAKSGIPNMFISRMREGLFDWSSPDGTDVRVFSVGHYGWEKFVWHFFDSGVLNAFDKVHTRTGLWNDYYLEHRLNPVYAVIMSNDASMPDSYTELITQWNNIVSQAEVRLPRLTYSTMERFLTAVASPESSFEQIGGERPDLWLYIHGPAHYEQTCDKRRAAILLPAAEFFSTVNYLSGTEYPAADITRGWMASIYPDHGLGGKNGEITDAIFADSLAAGREMGEKILQKHLEYIASQVKGKKGDIVVFNDLPARRCGMAEVPVYCDRVAISDASGREIPSQVRRRGDSLTVCFMADVPSMGYSRYSVRTRKGHDSEVPAGVDAGSNYFSNKFYDITFGDGGIVRLYDRELGVDVLENEKFALGDVIDAEYSGNGAGEFVQITPLSVQMGGQDAASRHQAVWEITASGPLLTTFQNRISMGHAVLVQEITIYHEVKKIDFDVRLEDFTGEHNRQFRILFPAKMKLASSEINYETPYFVAQVGRDELNIIPGGYSAWGTYTQNQAEVHPREVQNFISANGNGFGMTLTSGVAVCDWIDPSVEIADYPVLQGVLLSSHKSCHGEGNWYHQTGTHSFHFSLTTHPQGWKNGYEAAVAANHPFYTVQKQTTEGGQPQSFSYLSVSDPFVSVSTMKKADNSDAVILRLVEMEGRDKDVQITLPFEAAGIVKCNLMEEEDGELPLKGKTITFHLGHNAVETFKIRH